MGVLVSSGGASDAGAVLIDVMESWDGLKLSGNNPVSQVADYLSSAFPAPTPTNNVLLSATLGATGALGFSALVGRTTQVWASGAAATGNASAVTAGPFGVPIGRKFGLAASVPFALLARFRRYQVDFLNRITTIGTAEATCGFGVSIAALVNGNTPACMWTSRPGTNAGRWMPRIRLVTAGGITDGPDSGVSPYPGVSSVSGWAKLSVIYEEGITPRVRWLVNDREVHQIAGDAAMPTMTALGNELFLLTKGLSSPAGTTVEYCATRFRCQEM
jgi:hypothetical protein